MLRAVLWDLDGTLVDSEPAHAAALDSALAELGIAVGPAFHDRCLGASEDAVHAALVAETGTAMAPAAWQTLKWRHYRGFAHRIAARPEVAGLVPPLAAAGVAMAVVSNSTRAEVDLALAALGLDRLLSVTVSRADVARGKPDPEGYMAAAARLGAPPAGCVVIEDSPTGVAAGLAAGMTTVFHPQDPALAAPAGALVAGPDGLAALLGRLGLPLALPFRSEGEAPCVPRG
jgi:HAD superfamily hydrolase (TIGR01509 family)